MPQDSRTHRHCGYNITRKEETEKGEREKRIHKIESNKKHYVHRKARFHRADAAADRTLSSGFERRGITSGMTIAPISERTESAHEQDTQDTYVSTWDENRKTLNMMTSRRTPQTERRMKRNATAAQRGITHRRQTAPRRPKAPARSCYWPCSGKAAWR